MDYLSLGILLAASTGLFFGLHDTCVRLAKLESSGSGVLISLMAGYPIILLLALFFNGFEFKSFKALILYVLAGILNFSVGRTSMYTAISRLGAGVASVLIATSVLYNLLLGLSLEEELGYPQVIGSLAIILSVTLLAKGEDGRKSLDPLGLLSGLLAGISIALSILLGRLGNIESGNPIAGVFIAYTSGLIAEVVIIGYRKEISVGDAISYINMPIALAGILASAGQAARYIALMSVGISIVTPLQNTRPIVATLTSNILSKQTGEEFNMRTVVAAIMALLGATLIII